MIYTSNFKILESQVDQTNHLSNVQYYAFFKSCLYEFFDEIKLAEIAKTLWPVVFEETCSFKQELFFKDTITVTLDEINIYPKKNKWLVIMNMLKNGNPVARYESLHGILDKAKRRIVPLSDSVLELMLNHRAVILQSIKSNITQI